MVNLERWKCNLFSFRKKKRKNILKGSQKLVELRERMLVDCVVFQKNQATGTKELKVKKGVFKSRNLLPAHIFYEIRPLHKFRIDLMNGSNILGSFNNLKVDWYQPN